MAFGGVEPCGQNGYRRISDAIDAIFSQESCSYNRFLDFWGKIFFYWLIDLNIFIKIIGTELHEKKLTVHVYLYPPPPPLQKKKKNLEK